MERTSELLLFLLLLGPHTIWTNVGWAPFSKSPRKTMSKNRATVADSWTYNGAPLLFYSLAWRSVSSSRNVSSLFTSGVFFGFWCGTVMVGISSFVTVERVEHPCILNVHPCTIIFSIRDIIFLFFISLFYHHENRTWRKTLIARVCCAVSIPNGLN